MTLSQRVASLAGPDREVDEAIQCALVGAEIEWSNIRQSNCYYRDGHWVNIGEINLYTASLDAAMTLVPEGWKVDYIQELLDEHLCTAGLYRRVEGREIERVSGNGLFLHTALASAALSARGL